MTKEYELNNDFTIVCVTGKEMSIRVVQKKFILGTSSRRT